MPVYVLLVCSIACQLVAAAVALRLIRVTGRPAAWTLVTVAVLLMAVRRGVKLLALIGGHALLPPDITEEIIALAISALLALGLLRVAPAFHALRRSAGALREKERALSVLMSNLPGMAYRCRNDRHWTMEFVSEGCLALTGHPCQELVGESGVRFADLIHPEDREPVWKDVQAALAEDRPFRLTYRITAADGSRKWVWEQGRRISSPGKSVEFLEGFVTDITERKRAEQQRRESERMLQLVMDNIPQFIFWKDRRSVYLGCNTNFARVAGMEDPSQVVGKTDYDLPWQKEEADFFRECDRRVMESGQPEYHIVESQLQADGKHAWLDTNKVPLKNERGEVVGILGTYEDVTERRLLEDQVRQAQKMKAVGQLAGGVAHDFNNILTAIFGYLDVMRNAPASAERVVVGIEQIDKAAQRAAALTRQLLAFSRRQVSRPEILDLSEIVGEMEPMLRRLLGERIELEVAPEPRLDHVRADAGQIEQVLMNLVINARDAMPTGGRLIVQTANTVLDDEYARAHTGARAGPHVMLAVSDTGCGMKKEVADRVFEPFFSTKPRGKGTGLGLASVFGVVKQSGGHIWLYSEPGQGTTFKIYLPAVQEPLSPRRHQEAAGGGGGSETVLLVEDDASVRQLAGDVLQDNGYTVFTAASGREAREIAAREVGEIDLLLTDVVMPDTNGRKLADALVSEYPFIRVLYMSGYSSTVIAHHGVLKDGVELLEKPFTADRLLRRVREVLDSAPAATD